MRVFITGGTGFIGRHVFRELKRRKHRVLALSLTAEKEQGATLIKGDLSSIKKWERQLRKFKPQVAIHLAWEGIPDFSYSKCVKNLEIGLALFDVLAAAGCKKIIAAGTGFEYNGCVGKIPDAIDVRPTSAIAASKHALHLMGEALAREHKMGFIWIRPFNPYGPGQRSGSLIPHIMRSVAIDVPLHLKNPLAQGDFVYVGDVARAIADTVSRGRGYATYNIGSGKLSAVKNIAKLVCREMKTRKSYYESFARTAKGKTMPAPYADIKKIRKEIGWRPTTNLEKGIRNTVREFDLSDILS